MTLNPDVIRSRCAEIEDSVRRLESLAALPLADFLADRDVQDIASYRFLVAIEASLALCYHVSSRQLRTVPSDYADCFAVLGEAGILASDLTDRLKNYGGFSEPSGPHEWEVRSPAGTRRATEESGRPPSVLSVDRFVARRVNRSVSLPVVEPSTQAHALEHSP